MRFPEIQSRCFSGLVVVVALAFGTGPAQAQDNGAGAFIGGMGVFAVAPADDCTAGSENSCLRPDQIAALQAGLSALGLEPGPVDGILGSLTLQALDEFREWANSGNQGDYPGSGDLVRINAAVEALTAQTRPSTAQARRAAVETPSRSLFDDPQPVVAAAVALPPQTAPTPTRAFAGPGQFPPAGFRGYGFVAFPARASDFDLDRHMIICQAYLTSLPSTSSVQQSREDQFVTVWPLVDPVVAAELNLVSSRAQAGGACSRAIDAYDDSRSRDVISMVRQNDAPDLEGRGPFLFGWIPADGYGEEGNLILMLDLSRVTTYEQALTQLQSWQQKVETNPELLRDGFSLENLRRLVRDWSDLNGNAFLILIGRG